ncbi:hypothetical protein G3I19_00230 [Streptomyces sp. SID10853]|uniref:hypothetical protein n=1 Tax=Streptomyces sp. SID10853 TaxID=2706028 RepID=UPI0013BEE2DD|nr:hypothetical protein [Streptomyces sp. SID10853]
MPSDQWARRNEIFVYVLQARPAQELGDVLPIVGNPEVLGADTYTAAATRVRRIHGDLRCHASSVL